MHLVNNILVSFVPVTLNRNTVEPLIRKLLIQRLFHLGLLQAWVPFAFARLGGVGVGLIRVLKRNHDTEFEGELCVLFRGPKVALILLGCK